MGADGCKGLAVDVSGNIYLSGNFNDTADFNPETGVYNLISAGFTDVFVLNSVSNHYPLKKMQRWKMRFLSIQIRRRMR
ncbi:MAG: hypothetical protein IPM91_00435 [Bacteroidetes bacterium]|nr:hypothetical protein [Bacteroidota bacterium]